MPRLRETEDKPSVDYAAEESMKLTKALARKCRLTEGKRTGRIEIEFYDPDDREALLENLYRMAREWNRK
jgi:hypothetical protein